MAAEQTLVESSPTIEVDRGPLVNLSGDERAEFRRTGELPEPPKKEAAAASDTDKDQTSETAGESESPKKTQEQNRRKPGAEHRIAELTSEVKRYKAELESLRSAKPAPPVIQPKPQEVPQAQPVTRAKPTAEDKGQDGKPKYNTYEDFVEDLADWKTEQRMVRAERETQAQLQAKQLGTKIDDARARYGAESFDKVLAPTVDAIINDKMIVGAVKTMLNESEVLPDLIFTLGTDQKELASFVKMAKENPGKALRYIALTESLIREEFESKGKPETKTVTAKPITNAPKPPSEVGGRAAAPGDEMESAVKSNDFSRFKAIANRQSLARLKG